MRTWLLVLCIVAACGRARDRRTSCQPPEPGKTTRCRVEGWADRSFDLHVPATWDRKTSLPFVLLLHGGGGNRGNANKTTCPDGDKASPGCFAAVALARGYAVAIPDGSTFSRLQLRTWNAGGGVRTGSGVALECVSGKACEKNVDDVRYVRELLDVVSRALPIDQRRVFATGLSNGGAMSHRLACELPDRFAAIVSVGGGNQHAAAGGACGGAAVMELHGTRDQCWPYAGGGGECIAREYKVGAEDTMTAWAKRNGCTEVVTEEPLPDRDPADGVTSTRRRWSGCTRATELVRSDGAGHTWPSGDPYSNRAGVVTRDFGSEIIVDFFDANPR